MTPRDIGLFLVPTPIGNLDDITIRALDTLKNSDLILAEDTRKTKVLLNHYNIGTPLQSHHAHNEHKSVTTIIKKLRSGSVISLVSDAGTPAISDPGYLLVRECLKEGIEVECLPGATAFVPAVVKSGIACERFTFEGFLPHKKGRKKRLEQLVKETRTMIFYESPQRLIKSLTQMGEYFGMDRQASVSRELTKIHEETVNGSIQEILDYYSENTLKGEMVVVIAGTKKIRKDGS